MRTRTILLLIVIAAVLLAAGYWVAQNLNLMPVEASTRAVAVDRLFRVMLGVAAVIFFLVEGALLYSVIRFRRRPGDETDAVPVQSNRALEIAWTLIPAVIVVVIGVYAFRVLTDIEAAAPDPLVVNVHSRQFSWLFDYPQAGVTSTELHLPVNIPVRFMITSDDVIHSFWVPDFRAKRDATPGEVSELVMTPDRIGVFPIRCAELCGPGHAAMGLSSQVVVQSQADFDAWLAQTKSAANDPGSLFKQFGCNGCHTLTSVGAQGKVGPVLDGIGQEAGTRVPGQDARTYLTSSIVKPSDFVVPGYPDHIMPQERELVVNTRP